MCDVRNGELIKGQSSSLFRPLLALDMLSLPLLKRILNLRGPGNFGTFVSVTLHLGLLLKFASRQRRFKSSANQCLALKIHKF